MKHNTTKILRAQYKLPKEEGRKVHRDRPLVYALVYSVIWALERFMKKKHHLFSSCYALWCGYRLLTGRDTYTLQEEIDIKVGRMDL